MSDVINRFNVGFTESKSSIPVTFASGGGGGGNYERLQQKPRINDVELVGNKSSSDLGLADASTVNAILSFIAGTEQSMIATKAYSEHDLVIIENKLYVVTSPIEVGSRFVVGTDFQPPGNSRIKKISAVSRMIYNAFLFFKTEVNS